MAATAHRWPRGEFKRTCTTRRWQAPTQTINFPRLRSLVDIAHHSCRGTERPESTTSLPGPPVTKHLANLISLRRNPLLSVITHILALSKFPMILINLPLFRLDTLCVSHQPPTACEDRQAITGLWRSNPRSLIYAPLQSHLQSRRLVCAALLARVTTILYTPAHHLMCTHISSFVHPAIALEPRCLIALG